MSSPRGRHNHEERPWQALQIDPTRRWYQHPLVVFVVPLIALLCIPRIYTSFGGFFYKDAQLQEIAALMDDIYTLLAASTFIPPTAIKRGPHQINMTAIPCKRDPAVLRLMELLPYVDKSQVEESDWLLGGEFMDYLSTDMLQEGCDPLRANAYWEYMTPETVALTSWGSGGWNGDRTFVMMYDTVRHAIRVYEGEEWIEQHEDPELKEHDYTGVGIFSEGITTKHSVFEVLDDDWAEWFDAPTLLARLRDAYRTGAWSPWESSYREDGWGVDGKNITQLLRKSGWPNDPTFEIEFRADFIRAQNTPSGRGWAEAAFKIVEDLEGKEEPGLTYPSHFDGRIDRSKGQIKRFEKLLQETKDPAEQWLLRWRINREELSIQRHELELKAAKQEIKRLCPQFICVEKEDMVLWAYRAIEKEHDKAKGATNFTIKCQQRMEKLPHWAPEDPDRFSNCLTQLSREHTWLQVAYEQTFKEASEYCTNTGKTLLKPDTLEDRAAVRIAEVEQGIAEEEELRKELLAWQNEFNLSEERLGAVQEWIVNSLWLPHRQEELEKIRERLAEGGDKASLWRHLDSEDWVW
jgi:hypothetical protein